MKISKKIEFISAAVVLTFLLFFLCACNEFKSEEFKISDKDQQACAQITDSILNRITLKNLILFDSTWVDSTVTLFVPTIMDSLIKYKLVVSETDTADTISTLANRMINYVAFLPKSATVIFYFDQALDLVLIKENGDLVNPSNANMPYEIMAGCQGIDNISQKIEPVIKTRFEFGTTEERYLLMLIKNDQTKSSNIRTAILPM